MLCKNRNRSILSHVLKSKLVSVSRIALNQNRFLETVKIGIGIDVFYPLRIDNTELTSGFIFGVLYPTSRGLNVVCVKADS